ncbi:hypothetical protein ABKV19_010068 [Rosa sericea]
MTEAKKDESQLISAAAFVEGGIQDACAEACSICLEDFCESDPSVELRAAVSDIESKWSGASHKVYPEFQSLRAVKIKQVHRTGSSSQKQGYGGCEDVGD